MALGSGCASLSCRGRQNVAGRDFMGVAHDGHSTKARIAVATAIVVHLVSLKVARSIAATKATWIPLTQSIMSIEKTVELVSSGSHPVIVGKT